MSGDGVEADEALKRDTEKWFVRRGLPHFIDRYNAAEDIFTRAAPFLSVVFVIYMIPYIDTEAEARAGWAQALSVVVVVTIGIVGLGIVNTVRGRRFLSRPRRIGWPEIVGFLAIPTITNTVTGINWYDGLNVLLTLLIVLGITYVVTSYGLVPMTRWAVGQMFRQFRRVTNLFVRSLPLLLLFTMFMFFNAEMWKIADDIPPAFMWTSIAMMVLVGSAFILLRFPQELSGIALFSSWREVDEEVGHTPLVGLAEGMDLPDPPPVHPLSRRARFNVGLVLFFSQAVQVLLVTVAVFGFYIAFGMFTIVPTTIEQWTGVQELDVLGQFEYFDSTVVVTGELVKSSLFIAAVAGLQFAVSALVDSTYRDEFYHGLTGELRESLAVRARYLARFAAHREEVDTPAVTGEPRES